MAELVCKMFRDSHSLGGNELVVLLSGTANEHCSGIQTRFNQALESFNENNGKPYQLSYSMGIVGYDATTAPDINMLQCFADDEMYFCKK
ncbi:UNVERIFIED_CONTAM: GGDEF domain-containing protein [Aeromonas hydrophila]